MINAVNLSLAFLQALYHWRHSMARQWDEGTGYVLANHLLLRLGESQ